MGLDWSFKDEKSLNSELQYALVVDNKLTDTYQSVCYLIGEKIKKPDVSLKQ